MSTLTRKTDQKPSMPPRGKRPGFKRGRRGLPYWIAKQVTRDVKGYPDTCVALPVELPPDAKDPDVESMWARLCRENTEKLRQHIERIDANPSEPRLKTRYDGTMMSACRIYQEHPLSDFHEIKFTTAKTYKTCLRRIEATVGQRLIRNLTRADFKKWYKEWRKPEITIDDDGRPVIGNERIDRAHDTIAMVRTVIYFMGSIGNEECEAVGRRLEKVKFEKGAAREGELTYQHVNSFVRTATELAGKGVIPRERALYMSIGVTAQFELALREMDVIGEYAPIGAKRRLPNGIVTLDLPPAAPTEQWAGFFTWENIPGWRWRTRTSKSKYRARADFDLTKYSLLFPLLEAVPLHERTGAIIKGERGLPIRARSYYNWFKDIAEVAGIPREVWKMDARAGGATEAFNAGATIKMVQGLLTHEEERTTLRYIRRHSETITGAVADLRDAKRKAENDGGTT
jgi:hypothetical protein